MPKKLIISLVLAILSFSACTKKGDEIPEKPLNPLPKEVEIYRISSETPDLSFQTTGLIEAENKATVISEITGQITEVYVEIGDEIKENQLLAKLGNSLNTNNIISQHETALKNLKLTKESTNLTIANAKKNLELTKTTYENAISNKYDVIRTYQVQLETIYHQLNQAEENYDDAKDYYYDNKNQLDEISKENAKQAKDNAKYQVEQLELSIDTLNANYYSQVDQVEYNIDSSKNQHESAQNQLNLTKTSTESQLVTAEYSLKIAKNSLQKTQICSPIEGQITNIYFDENDFVNMGTAIIEIEKLDKMIIKSSINAEEKSLIEVGDKIYLEANIKGEISSINPKVNPLTQKFDVEIEVENSNLVSGQNIQINFVGKSNNRIFVPTNAIFLKTNKEYLYILNNKNQVHSTEVKTGEIIGKYIEILEGLSGNERIVKSNIYSLKEDERIKISNPIKIKRY